MIIVAERLRHLLRYPPAPVRRRRRRKTPPNYDLVVRYVRGTGSYHLSLNKRQPANGQLQTLHRRHRKGQVMGLVTFNATLGYQSNMVEYRFTGRLRGGTIAGKVSLGEYGTAEWQAERA